MTEVLRIDLPNESVAHFKEIASVLLALSRVFSHGGESLDKTLPMMVKTCHQLGEYYPELLSMSAELENHCLLNEIEQQQLCFEFNRLFIGPTPPIAPPYESVYLSQDQLVMQEQTVKVRSLYQDENLMVISQGKNPDDFMATELEFAAYLLRNADKEAMQNKGLNRLKYYELYTEFSQEHLRKWLPKFVERVHQKANHPVFPMLMDVLLCTIELPLQQRRNV